MIEIIYSAPNQGYLVIWTSNGVSKVFAIKPTRVEALSWLADRGIYLC